MSALKLNRDLVLIVDDEEDVRMQVKAAVREVFDGIEVVEASTFEDMIGLILEFKDRALILISDGFIPGSQWTGCKFLIEARECGIPNLAYFSSDAFGARNDVEACGSQDSSVTFISKEKGDITVEKWGPFSKFLRGYIGIPGLKMWLTQIRDAALNVATSPV